MKTTVTSNESENILLYEIKSLGGRQRANGNSSLQAWLY